MEKNKIIIFCVILFVSFFWFIAGIALGARFCGDMIKEEIVWPLQSGAVLSIYSQGYDVNAIAKTYCQYLDFNHLEPVTR